MKVISSEEITKAVRDLCIKASYDLPKDVEECIRTNLDKEQSEFGKYCISQILSNIDLAREHQQALCQDTGIVVAYLEVGQEVQIVDGDINDAVHEGVRQGYEDGYLRKSVVFDPLFGRDNTGDNTPAIIHTEIVPGDQLTITVVPKGGGSENMGALKLLKPSEGLAGAKEFILETVKKAGGNPCPPIVVGIGVGGTMEKAPELAKKALLRDIGTKNPNRDYAQLEQELLESINKLGIGPQGLGGRVTALAVHIEYYPTHIATLPVAVNINCHAARHKTITL